MAKEEVTGHRLIAVGNPVLQGVRIRHVRVITLLFHRPLPWV